MMLQFQMTRAYWCWREQDTEIETIITHTLTLNLLELTLLGGPASLGTLTQYHLSLGWALTVHTVPLAKPRGLAHYLAWLAATAHKPSSTQTEVTGGPDSSGLDLQGRSDGGRY